MWVETFNDNEIVIKNIKTLKTNIKNISVREGEETITKLFTGLVSVRVAKDCDVGLENAATT